MIDAQELIRSVEEEGDLRRYMAKAENALYKLADTIDELSDLVGLTEAAEIMCITKTAMANYHRRLLNPKPRQRIFFPKPVATLACGPIWTRAQVMQFKKELDVRKAARANG